MQDDITKIKTALACFFLILVLMILAAAVLVSCTISLEEVNAEGANDAINETHNSTPTLTIPW